MFCILPLCAAVFTAVVPSAAAGPRRRLLVPPVALVWLLSGEDAVGQSSVPFCLV